MSFWTTILHPVSAMKASQEQILLKQICVRSQKNRFVFKAHCPLDKASRLRCCSRAWYQVRLVLNKCCAAVLLGSNGCLVSTTLGSVYLMEDHWFCFYTQKTPQNRNWRRWFSKPDLLSTSVSVIQTTIQNYRFCKLVPSDPDNNSGDLLIGNIWIMNARCAPENKEIDIALHGSARTSFLSQARGRLHPWYPRWGYKTSKLLSGCRKNSWNNNTNTTSILEISESLWFHAPLWPRPPPSLDKFPIPTHLFEPLLNQHAFTFWSSRDPVSYIAKGIYRGCYFVLLGRMPILCHLNVQPYVCYYLASWARTRVSTCQGLPCYSIKHSAVKTSYRSLNLFVCPFFATHRDQCFLTVNISDRDLWYNSLDFVCQGIEGFIAWWQFTALSVT